MNSEYNKEKLFKYGSWALIVLTVFLAVETIGAFKNLGGINPAYNSISVTGEGESVSIPDVATFSFTVSADAKEVSLAQEAVTTKMDAILAALKNLGIEERDIKTTDYSVYPKYEYTAAPCTPTMCPPSRQVQDGYTVSHNVTVKVRNTEQAGQALSVAGSNGATNISSVSFTVDDPDEIIEEARIAAIADAKEKAEVLADELGVRLVRVVSFYDNQPGYPVPMYAEAGMGGDSVEARNMSTAPKLPTGENKYTAQVTVTYEIR